MKQLLSLTLFLFMALISNAQTAIGLDKMNVLYVGVDNPITVASSEGKDEKLTVTVEGGGGTVTKIGGGKYIVRVTQLADNCLINVFLKDKLIGQSQFRVRSIPEPRATVAGMMSGESMPVGQFKAQAGVAAYVLNFPYDLPYQVVSYVFVCSTESGDLIEIHNEGSYFSAGVINAIRQNVKPGSFVIIRDIQIKGPDQRISKANSLVYYIK